MLSHNKKTSYKMNLIRRVAGRGGKSGEKHFFSSCLIPAVSSSSLGKCESF